MNSIRLEHAGRGLLLCGLLLASNLVYAQWDYSRIEVLTDEANSLKEQGFFANAYQLYPTIMHQMRIHNGLYSEDQLPLLMEMATWHARKSEHEEAKNLLDRTEFYMGRNPNPLDNYRILIVQRLYLPDEQRCHERGKNGFLNPSNYCDKQRYYRADSFIAATQLMVKIVAISDNRKSDLIALAGLAQITAYCVYDVYGSSYSFNTHINMISKTLNIRGRENYQHQKWSGIQRHTLAQLQIEFDYGG